MNILTLLELAKDDPTVRYEGRLDVAFEGFSFPGIRIEPNRFYVVMDHSWPKTGRVRYKQDEWTVDETIRFATKAGIKNFVLPSVLRGAEFTRGKNCIYADDVHEFIGRIGLAARWEAFDRDRPLVGITGAAGKSTLKAMITHAYQQGRPRERVLSPGVHFNLYVRAVGELARFQDFDAAVVEMSGGVFDQFKKRRTAISPDVAVITTISEAHTQQLGSVDRVAEQKSQIFDDPRPGSTAVINRDTVHADRLIDKARAEGWQLALFGESEEADYRLLRYDAAEQVAHVRTPHGEASYWIAAPGKHMAYNTLATLATLNGLGFDDLTPAIESFKTFEALPGRGATEAVTLPGGGALDLIDESYNANPASMKAIIETVDGLKLQDRQKRRVLVLGDMLELGVKEKELHRELFELLNPTRVDRIYLLGELMGEVASLTQSDERFLHVETREQLVSQLKDDLVAGDVVAFKSSHSTGLDKVIAELRKAWGKEA